MKKINPDKVYLHVRVGSSPFPIERENLTYWHLFFTSPNIYKNLKLTKDKIRLLEFNDKNKNIILEHPFFLKKQKYNNESVLFSGLKMFELY